ncbi:hypothetical protein [Dactylosporangium sp. NPDC051541]|uniref:hypothetical protein n=1 Tax=Dactylosporangium sp. NPDC051541 TaxID=3363977 RepID=UPI003789E8EE
MPLPLPRLSNVVDLAMSAAGTAVGTVAAVVALPGRVVRLVDGAEVLLARATAAVDTVDETMIEVRRTAAAADALVVRSAEIAAAADALVARSAEIAAGADVLVARSVEIAAGAEAVAARAAATAGTAEGLLTAYEPSLRRFVDNLSADEVTAAIRMVDELPRLAHHLNTDVMPILATLDKVGPDIHELLNVTRDLRQAIVGIPGFGMLRRRGAASEADEA